MPDALTQKDIDSLLKGGGSSAPRKKRQTLDVIPYNFRRPPLISRDRQATLEVIYGRLALSLQAMLSSNLRTASDVVVSSVEQATFAEFTFSLSSPCAAFTFRLGPDGDDSGAIDLGIDLAYYLVDRLFGGPGEVADIQRPLTQLEQLVARGVAEKMLVSLREVWAGYLEIEARDMTYEAKPEALQIASREDNVLVANMEVRVQSFSGWLSVCLPLHALEVFLQEKPSRASRAAARTTESRHDGRRAIETSLRSATLPVRVRFPAFTLSTSELATIQVGNVLHTGHVLDEPVELHVCERPRFTGSLGQVRKRVGVQVSQHVTDTGERTTVRVPRGRLVL